MRIIRRSWLLTHMTTLLRVSAPLRSIPWSRLTRIHVPITLSLRALRRTTTRIIHMLIRYRSTLSLRGIDEYDIYLFKMRKKFPIIVKCTLTFHNLPLRSTHTNRVKRVIQYTKISPHCQSKQTYNVVNFQRNFHILVNQKNDTNELSYVNAKKKNQRAFTSKFTTCEMQSKYTTDHRTPNEN